MLPQPPSHGWDHLFLVRWDGGVSFNEPRNQVTRWIWLQLAGALATKCTTLELAIDLDMGVNPKIGIYNSQIIHFDSVFPYVHHPFWGTIIFGNTHMRTLLRVTWSLNRMLSEIKKIPTRLRHVETTTVELRSPPYHHMPNLMKDPETEGDWQQTRYHPPSTPPGHDTTSSFQAQGKGRHIQQNDVLQWWILPLVAYQHCSLHSCTIGHGLKDATPMLLDFNVVCSMTNSDITFSVPKKRTAIKDLKMKNKNNKNTLIFCCLLWFASLTLYIMSTFLSTKTRTWDTSPYPPRRR